MPAQNITCPHCKTPLPHQDATPFGLAQTQCSECGGAVPLVPADAAKVSDLSTLPPQSAAQDTGASISGAPRSETIGTLVAPPGPPSSSEYPFLSPPQQADELGRLGPYRVLGMLGAGGMGAVFRAEDPVLRRQIALKVMLPQYAANSQAKARFLREARAQAAVEHDHIIAIYQVGEERDVPFLAMPLLKGQTLADALKAKPVLPVVEATRIAREIAAGLAAAHEANLVHRDIKPANVWLEGRQRRVKILDFGLARVESATDGMEAVTQQGAIIGTPAYMSPEQATGEPLDSRTDLFSLGVVLYQMLTGRQPFTGKNTPAILVSVTSHSPPPPAAFNPQVPAALDVLTMRLLAKSVADRPTSADGVVEDLRTIETGNHGPSEASVPAVALDADPGVPIAKVETHPPSETRQLNRPHPGSGSNRPKAQQWVLVGSLLTFCGLTVLAADIVIKIKNKDGNEIEIKVPDSSTVTVTKDGTDVAKVRTDPKMEMGKTIPAGPVKGTPELKNPDKPTPLGLFDDRAVAEHAIRLGGWVEVNGKSGDTITAIDQLPRAPFRLTTLYLSGAEATTEAVLANFRNCKNLTSLCLRGAPLSDGGLASFKDCKNLRVLMLESALVTDAGLANFQDCEDLTELVLTCRNVGDKGLAHFKNCKALTGFDVGYTRVSDEGLAYFQDSGSLKFLNLHGCIQVTDVGLTCFKNCDSLVFLDLSGVQVTDDGLANFKDCKNLHSINLNSTKVSDAGLVHLKNCTELKRLELNSTRVSDVGLANFANCNKLMSIDLRNTRVSDAGLIELKDLKSLQSIVLEKTQVSEEGVNQLSIALPKCVIDWDRGRVAPKK